MPKHEVVSLVFRTAIRQSARGLAHCYELCQERLTLFPFFIKRFFLFSFLPGPGFQNVLLAAATAAAVALPAIRARPHRDGTS
jgi:hypothetical protein